MEGCREESCSARSSNATVSIPAFRASSRKICSVWRYPSFLMNERMDECNSSLKELIGLLVSAEVESFLEEVLCVIYEANQGYWVLDYVQPYSSPISRRNSDRKCFARIVFFTTLKYFSLIIFSTPEKLVMSYNGGKDCTVLLDIVWKVWKRFPEFSKMKLKTVYVAEDEPFPELEKFISDTVKR